MAKKGSFIGKVAKMVLIGLAASYIIKLIQKKMDEHKEEEGEEEDTQEQDSGKNGKDKEKKPELLEKAK